MSSADFIDRRKNRHGQPQQGAERRQFVDGREHLSPEARELADAIDRYKLDHHRRFIDHEELLGVVLALGYRKLPAASAGERDADVARAETPLPQTEAVLASSR